MILNIDKYDVMKLTGLSKTQAQNLIRQAKFLMVSDGFSWYQNKKIGRVPTVAVEKILGYSLHAENGIIDGVQDVDSVVGKENFNDGI